MRKFYLFALVAALFAACTNDTTEDVAVEVPQTLTVSFEEDTRIQLMNGKTVWNTGDLVSVFYKSDANDCYRFAGNTGERTSELVRTAKGEKSRSGDHIITVYPYSEDYIISLSAGTIEAHLPAEQTYVNESFGIGSSPMVSMSEYKQVVLKNVCGWLKVQFTGNGEVVDKITLRGNCGEQVAGDIMIVAEDASTILASAGMDIDDTEVGGTLVDEDSIITEVSLICPDGVTLGSEPTSFYIALPPQTFSKGLTVTVISEESGTMKQTTDKSITISRNIVQPLASVEANLQPNKIYYTSTDGKIVTPYRTTAFGGANIVSNTYKDGQGIITFDAPVTTIGNYAFRSCSSLTSVTIPDSVTTLGTNPFRSCSKLTEFNGKFASADKRCLIVNGVLNSFAPAGPTEYTIPDSVTTIRSYAFYGCNSLTSVTIPDSVTTIGSYAFYDCSLTSVTIGNSVTEIGGYAFCNCSSLTSVTIPDSVTEIGSYAFYYCSSLKSVYLTPTTPPTLGIRVFQYYNNGEYKNLECTIYVRSVALDKYKNAENWSGYNIAANSNELLYTSTDGKIVTPYSTTAFGGANIISNTYENGQGIITFDAPVTEIGYEAFYYRSRLTSVTIPDSVTEIGSRAFYGCNSLTSVTIPDSVTKIGESAFYDCSSLTNVTIPDSVTKIGSHAFYRCSSLTSVTIPDSVTTIGSGAFYKCSSLTSVTIPNSVTTLGANPFHSCSKLTEFNGKFASADKRCLIVDGVLNSFAPAGLTEYTIPDSVTEIGESAFSSCSSLTSVTIPDSVTKIGSYAFYKCSKLRSVYCNAVYPPTLASYAFGNTALENIYVYAESVDTYKAKWSNYADKIVSNNKSAGESVFTYTTTDGKTIDVSGAEFVVKSNAYADGVGKLVVYGENICLPEDAFSRNNTLQTITIPNSIISIEASAFYGCSNLKDVTISSSVTNIGSWAFYYCNSLEKICIPNNVTIIGKMAFYGCSNLRNVTIGNSVKKIGSFAFEYCSSLTSVTIPNSVTTLGTNPFEGCSKLTEFNGKFASADKRCLIVDGYLNSFAPAGLTEYTIPDSVTKIGQYAFYKCSSLKSVTIPNSVTEIGEDAFNYCLILASVTIPNSVTKIGNSAFYCCRSLKSVTIPNSVTEIGEDAFNYCLILASVTIPNSVTKIGDGAFYCCSLTSVTIPDSVTTLGANPFRSCSKLTEFNGKFASADKRCLIVDGVLNSFAPAGLTEYTIPDSVTEIGESAFSSCSRLTSVTIPDSVTEIGESAFSSCSSLTSVTIPNSVTEIGYDAFSSCSSLKSVYLTPTTPPQGGSSMFYNNATGRKIYVPRASESAYEAAVYWSNYAADIEPYDF